MRDLYLLHLTSASGIAMTAGPLPLIEAMSFVDAYVLPYGYQHRYRRVASVDEVIACLTVRPPKTGPVPGNSLMLALRRAIVCDRELDGADDDHTRQLLAHIDEHRPLQMWTGPEECLLGECEHPTPRWSHCPEVVPAEQLCSVCSVIRDSGSEYGPEYLLRVAWPCSVITTACARFPVTAAALPEQAAMADLATCRVCGCTEDRPCPGGCWWVSDPMMGDLCSSCPAEGTPPEVLVDDLVGLGRVALALGRVPRITYHPDGIRPESDTDHTVMLGLLASALAERCAPQLDLGLIAQYALVHDLIEVYAGDTPTLRAPTDAEKADKKQRELRARRRLAAEFAGLPWMTCMIDAYERQDSPEARWVKAIDKLAPKIAHLLNGGATIREQGLTRQQVADRYAAQAGEVAAYTSDFPILAELREVLVDRLLAALDTEPGPAPGPAGQPYRLEVVVDPDPQRPPAVSCFTAPSTAAAYRHARQVLAGHDGPNDRYGELYRADHPDPCHLDTIHLGA